MDKVQFLSDEWFDKVAALMAEQPEAAAAGAPAHASVTMNLVVTDTPFAEDRQMHMGLKEGKPDWGQGHVDGADVTLTTDYATAKEVFISGNPQAGMQAFMQGKIKVQGDMTKLMAMQGGGGPAGGNSVLTQIQEFTE